MITTLDAGRLVPPVQGSVVSIGVFDGVHLGHQATLHANVERARRLGAVPAVVTFRRHPKRVLLGHAPRTLTTLEHRLELFSRATIEHCLVLNFDEELRELSAEDFTRLYLVDGLGARAFVLGFDSKFGKERRGGPDFLRRLGHAVEVVPQVSVGGRPVSSTAIREAVELGDLAGAKSMLGRPVSVFGRVVRGEARGRELGFPTANLDLHHELHPPVGVYACQAFLLDRSLPRAPDGGRAWLPAVANIGFRPTLGGGQGVSVPVVEVHLMDFEGEIYGERVELAFIARIRAERRFDGLEPLARQIALDVAEARRILSVQGPPTRRPGG